MQSQDLCSIPSVTPYKYPVKRQSVTFLKPAAECLYGGLTADLTATANSPVVIFGQCLDCSLLHHESQKEGVLGLRSIADVDILWLTQ